MVNSTIDVYQYPGWDENRGACKPATGTFGHNPAPVDMENIANG